MHKRRVSNGKIPLKAVIRTTLKACQQRQIINYPDPANDKLFISLSSGNFYNPVLLTISNKAGRTIINHKITFSTIIIGISEWSSGIYFINLVIDERILIKKFIKD